MTYRITATVKSTGAWIGLSDFLNSLPFSAIQEKYSSMTEADWNAARVEMIDYAKGRSSLPGVTSFTETFLEDGNGVTHVWEWADEKAYLDWKNLPIHIEMAEKYGLSLVLAKRVVNFSLKEFFSAPGILENVQLGWYLMGLHGIENDIFQTITDETV
jgi:hypothetical protein